MVIKKYEKFSEYGYFYYSSFVFFSVVSSRLLLFVLVFPIYVKISYYYYHLYSDTQNNFVAILFSTDRINVIDLIF